MKSTLLEVAVAAVALAHFAPAGAANISAVKLDKGGTALFVTGEIKAGDGAKFRAEASKYDEAYVLLESDGGSLVDALDIGQTIRLKGYATAVINDSSCNSACALIWLAGSPRVLSRSGRVGFHAAYSDASGSAQESGVANAMVGRYLTLLNLPEKAVIFATSSPPSQLSWLTASNYLSTGIDVTVIDDINLAKASSRTSETAPPPLIRTVTTPATNNGVNSLWKNLDTWSVYYDKLLRNGCFLISAFDNNTVFRIGVDRSKDGYYVIFGNSAWTSLRVGQSYDVKFQFDQNSPWDVPTTAIRMGNSTMLMVTFKDPRFWDEFTTSSSLNVTRNGERVTNLSMSGAKPAFDELVSCQKYADSLTKTRDPFAQ